MRRLTMVLALVALGGAPLLVRPPSAVACSCMAPAPGEPHPEVLVEGTARASERHGRAGADGADGPAASSGSEARPTSWTSEVPFVVEAVDRGPLSPGDRIDVRTIRGDGAACGVDVEPLLPGHRYRVGGVLDEGTRRLHLNRCSGAVVEPLGGGAGRDEPVAVPTSARVPTTPPGRTTSTAVAVLDDGDAPGGLDARVVGAGAGALGSAGAGLLVLGRRVGTRLGPRPRR